MKLVLEPMPEGYQADKAIIMHEGDSGTYIMVACDNARATAQLIADAVNNIDDFKQVASVEADLRRMFCDKADKYCEALERIEQWSEAYPVDIFPEPDWDKARALLAVGGITLDAVSGSSMRRALEGVKQIAKEALQ